MGEAVHKQRNHLYIYLESYNNSLFVSWSAVLLRFLISKETVRRRIRESGHTLVRSLNKNKRFFTLTRVIQEHIDENGIGICKGIVCSIHEDAKTTIRHRVNRSRCGCTELELREYLKIVATWALLELYNAGLVLRAKLGHHYVYFSKDAEKRTNQIILRHGQEPRCGILFDAVDLKLVMGSVRAGLRKIVHDVLKARAIKDEDYLCTDIVIASFLRPLLRRRSDRDLAVYLKNHPGLDGFFNCWMRKRLLGTTLAGVDSRMRRQTVAWLSIWQR